MTEPEHSRWLQDLRASLSEAGSVGGETARFLQARGVQLGVRVQPTGARWTLDGRIELNPRLTGGPAEAPYALSLIVHEAEHLRQGWVTALSVYGELAAWQMQFKFLRSIVGGYHAVPAKDRNISDLIELPLGWDRAALRRARALMRAFAGKQYRVDLLPLYPLHLEIAYALVGRRAIAPLGSGSLQMLF